MFNQLKNNINQIINDLNLKLICEGNWSDEKEDKHCFDLFYDSDLITDDDFVESIYIIGKEIAKKYYSSDINIKVNQKPNEFNNLFESNIVINVF